MTQPRFGSITVADKCKLNSITWSSDTAQLVKSWNDDLDIAGSGPLNATIIDFLEQCLLVGKRLYRRRSTIRMNEA